MAVSTTTFEERIARINGGQTVDASAQVGRKSKKRSKLRTRMLTIPFLTGVGILTGGAAYAFASVQPEMEWVIAFVS